MRNLINPITREQMYFVNSCLVTIEAHILHVGFVLQFTNHGIIMAGMCQNFFQSGICCEHPSYKSRIMQHAIEYFWRAEHRFDNV
ncbi:hypothetical protein FRX31_003447 [Thalictrum thalictroides]|uniref:Uncharacterized protein n=1 Tax=Thalictrum thalictroides TaxID=46969 RepID=A0A7J6XD86_THATH|nr:hypothetical protein FRX31_003447 [Thalictrum thalictroides]